MRDPEEHIQDWINGELQKIKEEKTEEEKKSFLQVLKYFSWDLPSLIEEAEGSSFYELHYVIAEFEEAIFKLREIYEEGEKK